MAFFQVFSRSHLTVRNRTTVKTYSTLRSLSVKEGCSTGTKTLGHGGKFVVAGFTVLEFFGGSCIMLVVLWQEFVAVLPAKGRLALHEASCGSVHPLLCKSLWEMSPHTGQIFGGDETLPAIAAKLDSHE